MNNGWKVGSRQNVMPLCTLGKKVTIFSLLHLYLQSMNWGETKQAEQSSSASTVEKISAFHISCLQVQSHFFSCGMMLLYIQSVFHFLSNLVTKWNLCSSLKISWLYFTHAEFNFEQVKIELKSYNIKTFIATVQCRVPISYHYTSMLQIAKRYKVNEK